MGGLRQRSVYKGGVLEKTEVTRWHRGAMRVGVSTLTTEAIHMTWPKTWAGEV